jgi:DNA-binding XRE family transcriptional regulator
VWHVRVGSYRARNELTQEQVATMLGVDPRTIRRPPDYFQKYFS